MATFEQRNPYVGAIPALYQRTRVNRLGLLDEGQPQAYGLLGEQIKPRNETEYNQQQLVSQPQVNRQDLYNAYMNYMRTAQREKDQAAMEKSAIKGAKQYLNDYELGTGTAGNAAMAKEGYGSLDYANYNDQAAMIDDAGGAEAVNPDAGSGGGGSSGGSYAGAVTGALAGYGRGKKNYYTDPAMRDGKDGFGKYHRDYRAEVGGGVLGGVLGYYAPWATGFVGPVVDWVHPYAQDTTRFMINAGDQLGGAYGAMLADPIGAAASGKYSNAQLAASGLTPLLAPLFGGKAPGIADKASGAINDVGDSIADVFGW